MSGKPVRLAAAAAADLREIRRYTIEQWGHGQWLRYSEELDALFEQLSGNPALGPARDEIRLGLRSFPVGA
ncbi:MAG: type II toxin-antitoxin system RelE/ParE family toxin, partial [Salinisphaera sp.]|nr:type II toxin-antitoxin system RelE/ParE family toxin [Salinisphaera sp.]